MKKMSLLLLPLLFASVAQARPSTWEMTCSHTFDIVKSSRGIVMNYGYSQKAGYLYKMYYPAAHFCWNEGGRMEGVRAYVRTSDVARCWIGYECVHRNDD